MLAGSSATTVRIRKKLGKHSMISTNRITSVSIEIVLKYQSRVQAGWVLDLADVLVQNDSRMQVRPHIKKPVPSQIRSVISKIAPMTKNPAAINWLIRI